MSDIKLTDDLIKIITEKINKTGETITSDDILDLCNRSYQSGYNHGNSDTFENTKDAVRSLDFPKIEKDLILNKIISAQVLTQDRLLDSITKELDPDLKAMAIESKRRMESSSKRYSMEEVDKMLEQGNGNKIIHDCYVELKEFTDKVVKLLVDVANGDTIEENDLNKFIGEWQEYKQDGQ